MLRLYGNPRSRASRCLWMLEEMGEPYELVEKTTRTDDLQSDDYLRLNPNARIPTLVDGEVVLWESMAINLYLAQKFEGPMHCAGPEVLGLAMQWSFWAMLETEDLLLDLLQHRAVLPEFARDASHAERDALLDRLAIPAPANGTATAGQDYLVASGVATIAAGTLTTTIPTTTVTTPAPDLTTTIPTSTVTTIPPSPHRAPATVSVRSPALTIGTPPAETTISYSSSRASSESNAGHSPSSAPGRPSISESSAARCGARGASMATRRSRQALTISGRASCSSGSRA